MQIDRSEAIRQIRETCGEGWLTLVDVAFDHVPPGVQITEVFQKWGGLKIRFEGKDENYEELVNDIYSISHYLCEVCGKSARLSIIDGWETTLCDAHHEADPGKEKYRS